MSDVTMTHDRNAVRKILNDAKEAKRAALTAPQARDAGFIAEV